MDKRIKQKHIIFIALEFAVSLLFGVTGGEIFSLHDSYTLEASIFYTFCVVFASMIVGISVVGYFHFKRMNRLKDFGEAIVRSAVSLVLLLGVYILIVSLIGGTINQYIESVVLPILMPLIGGVFGLNFIFIKKA